MAIEDERPVVLAAWIGTATLEGLCPALVARFQHLGDHGIQNGFHISHISKGLSIPRRDCLLARVENMLDRLRVEPPAILLFMDNLTQSFYRTARENWLHARTAHTGSLEYSYVGLHKIETFHLVSTCLHCLVSVQHFRNFVFSQQIRTSKASPPSEGPTPAIDFCQKPVLPRAHFGVVGRPGAKPFEAGWKFGHGALCCASHAPDK